MHEEAKRKCKTCGNLFMPDNDFQGFCSERCYHIFRGETKQPTAPLASQPKDQPKPRTEKSPAERSAPLT